jgi:hypothetical protein
MKDFKEHAMFIGKVVVAVIIGQMIYAYIQKNMETRKAAAKSVEPTPITTASETVSA